MAGVYISYPFCSQKCTYCNFASGVFPRDLEPRYLSALRGEIRSAQWEWNPQTIYFGGGTPSMADPAALAEVLRSIPGTPWREVTLEAAPGGITHERATAWSKAGIDRISLGVQSFVQSELTRTGRRHTAEIVEREIRTLRDVDIENFNIDLIAGLPGQTRESWRESLDWVDKLDAPHVSVYMLEVDQDSRLGAEVLLNGRRYGAPDVPSDELIVEFYETAVQRLRTLGIKRYEISNFARPGCESRHNLKYWTRQPYLGFGSDAHSFDGEWRWENVESPADYVAAQDPVRERTPSDGIGERFYLGLRLEIGIAGPFEPFTEVIRKFVKEGLLQIEGDRIKLTPRGVLLSNEVFAEFVEAPE